MFNIYLIIGLITAIIVYMALIKTVFNKPNLIADLLILPVLVLVSLFLWPIIWYMVIVSIIENRKDNK